MYIGTPYDDSFRILLTECPKWIIALVNEIFSENYDGSEKINIYYNEHYVVHKEGGRKEIITDSSFSIEKGTNAKRYHIECQATKDKNVTIRMFEYDFQIGKEGKVYIDGDAYIKMPKSGIVYLRKNAEKSSRLFIDGIIYDIPSINATSYTIDEIFDKKLYFLIPFHVFVYEDNFEEYNEDKEKLKRFEKYYEDLWRRLKEALALEGYEDIVFSLILEQSLQVAKALAHKYENIMKGVVAHMYGVYHKSETRKLIERGISTFIARLRMLGVSEDKIVECLMEDYELEKEEALNYLKKKTE